MSGDTVPDHILEWAAARDQHRARGDFAAADALRDRIAGAGYHVTDTEGGPVVVAARRYRHLAPVQVPDRRGEDDHHDASVLLLLEAYGFDREPDWVVADAKRCLASVLEHSHGYDYEVCILDNGVGGDAGEWAADAARNPGISAVHLGQPVGFCEARALQHQMAVGRVLLWLDTGVELTGDLLGALAAVFADATIGAAGRWGGDLAGTVSRFAAVEPQQSGVRDVHAVWGYLLALRRELLRRGDVRTDHGFAFYRNADADLSFRVRAAGARTVVSDLPAVRLVHRGYAETPRELVERESRRNYRRLLATWRDEMQRLAHG